MKKNFFVMAFAVACLAGALHDLKTKRTTDDLLLMNVEALAAGEDESITRCLGSGSLTCPINNSKVEYILTGWSLDHGTD